MATQALKLDPGLRSNDTLDFDASLRAKIVGQEEGVQALVDLYQPEFPISTLSAHKTYARSPVLSSSNLHGRGLVANAARWAVPLTGLVSFSPHCDTQGVATAR